METKDFKNIFGNTAKKNGFEFAFCGWFKESIECILVLDLQKSNFGNYYDLNIKIYVQGCFGKTYSKCKYLVKNDVGDISITQPKEYSKFLNLDFQMEDNQRMEGLERLFDEFLNSFSVKALSRNGIKDLEKENQVFLFPPVRESLGI